jgi:hypothetical protein
MNDLKFESIATSIEQSNMLVKEFGMDVGTADMFWSTDFGILICSEYMTDNNLVPAVNACPAWSLTRLIKLMPTLTEYGRLSMVRNGEEVTEFRYGTEIIFGSPDPVDAAVQMIEWLLVHNLIRR